MADPASQASRNESLCSNHFARATQAPAKVLRTHVASFAEKMTHSYGDMTVSNGMDAPSYNGIDVPEWKCHQPLEQRERPSWRLQRSALTYGRANCKRSGTRSS
ncbi:hypothetical protein PSAC2689_100192 [Paraburkholderia sacchari]